MTSQLGRGVRVLGLALVLVFSGVAIAQESTIDIRSGEVLAVDGNLLTVRGPNGVRQFEVAEDFLFDIDGQKLTVRQLKPGMKLAAIITTTTTPVEMVETQYRTAEVINVLGSTVVVKNLETGEYRKFTARDAEANDLLIIRDGKAVSMSELRKGDRIAASIVSRSAPVLVTEQEVSVYGTKPAPAPAPKAAPSPAPVPAAAPAPAPVPQQLPKTASPLPLVGLIGMASFGLGLAARAYRRRR